MGHSPIPFPQKNRERKADYQTFIYTIREKIKQEYMYIYYWYRDLLFLMSLFTTNKIFMMFSIKFARKENCERNLILTTNFCEREKRKKQSFE